MTQVGSMEFAFKQTGAQAVMNGFKEIAAAAKQAEKMEKDRWKAAKEQAKAQTQAYRNAERQQKDALRSQMQADKEAIASRRRLTDWAKNNAVAFGAAAYAVIRTGKAIYDVGKAGAQIEYTRIKFDRLSKSMGVTSQDFMQRLRIATRGTVDDMKLAENGANLFQLGLARTADEAVRLSKIQTALGQDTGELTLALANQSKRRLDQLGLSLAEFNKIEAKLKSTMPGATKEDIFREAFMQTAEMTIKKTGNMADSSLGKYQQFEASVENMKTAGKVAVGEFLLPTIQDLSMFFNGINSMSQGKTQLDWSAIFGGGASWVKAGNANLPTADEIIANFMQQQGIFGRSGVMKNEGMARQILGQQQKETFLAGEKFLPGAAPVAAKPPDMTDYAGILQGGMQITQTTEQLTQATADLNEQIAIEQTEYDRLIQVGYNPAGERVQNQKQALEELKQKFVEIGNAQTDMTNQMMMNNIAAASSEDERAKNQMDYALATGQMTQQAYDQQQALMAIADAFAADKMNAQDAAAAADYVMNRMNALDGMTADVVINIIQNGSVPGMNNQLVPQSVQTSSGAIHNVRAGGGHLSGWTLVGEHGPELVSPKGYVYSNPQTRSMLASGYGASGRADAGDLEIGGGGTPRFVLGGVTRESTGRQGTTPGINDVSKVIDKVIEPLIEGVSGAVTAQSTVMHAQQQQLTNTMQTMTGYLSAILDKLPTAQDTGRAVAMNSIVYK